MERKSSFGASGGPVGLRQRPGLRLPCRRQEAGGGVETTKAAAARGLKKVKEGTAHGFQWIKGKVQKKKQGAAGAGDDAAAGLHPSSVEKKKHQKLNIIYSAGSGELYSTKITFVVLKATEVKEEETLHIAPSRTQA
ncbi:hypothetical protein ZWY2020_006823 [Hordeum vulgare]|nr:hypothetical protein ZWY2020_006823 [Hordeum vulgare]